MCFWRNLSYSNTVVLLWHQFLWQLCTCSIIRIHILLLIVYTVCTAFDENVAMETGIRAKTLMTFLDSTPSVLFRRGSSRIFNDSSSIMQWKVELYTWSVLREFGVTTIHGGETEDPPCLLSPTQTQKPRRADKDESDIALCLFVSFIGLLLLACERQSRSDRVSQPQCTRLLLFFDVTRERTTFYSYLLYGDTAATWRIKRPSRSA